MHEVQSSMAPLSPKAMSIRSQSSSVKNPKLTKTQISNIMKGPQQDSLFEERLRTQEQMLSAGHSDLTESPARRTMEQPPMLQAPGAAAGGQDLYDVKNDI